MRPSGLATWWRRSRGTGGRLAAVCDLVCELTGESKKGGMEEGVDIEVEPGVVTEELGCQNSAGGRR